MKRLRFPYLLVASLYHIPHYCLCVRWRLTSCRSAINVMFNHKHLFKRKKSGEGEDEIWNHQTEFTYRIGQFTFALHWKRYDFISSQTFLHLLAYSRIDWTFQPWLATDFKTSMKTLRQMYHWRRLGEKAWSPRSFFSNKLLTLKWFTHKIDVQIPCFAGKIIRAMVKQR